MSDNRSKRICFISARSAFITGRDSLQMDWANGRLIQMLVNHWGADFSLAIFGNPGRSENYQMNIHVNKLYELPFPLSFFGGIRNVFKFIRILKKIERENDLLIIQLPFVGFLSVFFIKKPALFHLCANVLTASANPLKYRGLIGIASRIFAGVMHKSFKVFFGKKNSKLIVNGDELGSLYHAYDPRIVVSSSILKDEIVAPELVKKRSPGDSFELLFVGRPSKEKGFPVLMRAFSQLLKEGANVNLSMVGVSKDELGALTDYDLNQEYLSRISFHGFVSWGDEFRRIVSSCHCLIMCSVSEGTPRVLIEARALGCPVIATRVGGVPSSITDQKDGLLVSILNSQEIVDNVKRLSSDESFRQYLIINGIERIRNCTLEIFSYSFVEEMDQMELRNEY